MSVFDRIKENVSRRCDGSGIRRLHEGTGVSRRTGLRADRRQPYISHLRSDEQQFVALHQSELTNMAMEAVRAGLPADTRVPVYWDGLTNYTGESKTVLTEIVKERRGGNRTGTEAVWRAGYPTDPAVMKAVLPDVQYYAPAEVYGISLHGHGTGWFPPELNNLRQPMSGEPYIEHDLRRPDNALTRADGPDGEEYMSAGDLAEGLSEIKFDYVIFDVRFSVFHPVCWNHLKDNARYILASPAEIMGKGIPYHKVLPSLFQP